MAGSPPCFALRALSSELPPPLPVLATLSSSTLLMTITWDQALVPGFSAAANWSAVAQIGVPPFLDYSAAGPFTVVGNTTTGTMVPGLPTVGANVANYTPPPFDVVGVSSGDPAAGFIDFRMTIIP